ncbi:MAG TPA: mechanosensitive ion channel domain-containing protein [Candidatus Dormibacteraeota bacterium]
MPKGVLVETVLVVIALAAFAAAWFLARLLRDWVGGWLVRHHVSGDAVALGRRVVYVTLLLIGTLAALSITFQSGNLTLAGIVVATVIASFGVQDVLRNYVSGYYVLLEGHLRVGDTIDINGHVGVIEDIRLRVSLLRSEDGSLAVVPNAELFNSTVIVVPPEALRTRRSARRLRQGAQNHPAQGLEIP